MWHVHAFPSPDAHTPVPAFEARRSVARGAIRDLLAQAAQEEPDVAQALPLATADLEAPRPLAGDDLPGLEAIGAWASRAAADFNALRPDEPDGTDLLRPIGTDALAWYSGGRPRGVARHDEALCVFPVSGRPEELEIEYRPEQADLARTAELERIFRLPSAMFLDCRLYLGALVHDVRLPLETVGPGGKVGFARVGEIGGGAGVGVARVFRWLGEPPAAPEHDRSWSPRLKAMAARPGANSTFDLRTAGLKSRNAVVVVHGLGACGVSSCFDLELTSSKLAGVYRYEHDTFLDIEDNAEELASLLTRPSPCEDVLIVGHSRGGLVARRAAQIAKPRLRGTKSKRSFRIWTYGAPHQGTPLVTRIERFAGLALLVGAPRVRGMPRPDRVTAAFSYLLGPLRQLPPGVACLAPRHAVLRSISNNVDPYPVRSHAADFDGDGPGYSVGLVGSWFDGRPNDTAVSVESARAAGTRPLTLADCCHSEYFTNAVVRDAIRIYLEKQYEDQ